MSNLYDFLAPNEEQLARLRATQAENQKIADQTGMKLTELNRMFMYGDPRGNILEDMGYTRPTLGMNLIQGREFLFGAQQKGFSKLKDGADFLDLTGEEQFGIVLSPLDLLDIGGLSFGLKKIAQMGLKKLGPKATLADAAQDKEIMKMLSDSEAQEVIQKLKPVIDGEQEFLLRAAKGPKQKKSVAPKVKDAEVVPGIKVKDFDESLLQTKPLKPAPTVQQGLPEPENIFDQPRDILKDSEQADPFLTPDESIVAPKTVEEVKQVKAKIDAVDVAQFQIFQNLPKGVRGAGLNPQKQKILLNYVDIMKSGDPFRIAALYRKTPEKTLRAMRDAAKQQKLITAEEITAARKQGQIVGLKTATDRSQDLAIRASDQIEKWKAGEIESVGGGKITFRELIKIFKEDPELAKHIGDEVSMADKPFKGGALKNLTNEEQWLLSLANGKLQNIPLPLLKPQLDEFPLASPYAIRETIEPTKYVKEFEYVLSEPQRLIRDGVRNKLREKLKQADFPIDPVRGKDFLAKGVERIIESGGTVEEAIEQIKNIDIDRLSELLIGREKFNVERMFYNDELEDVARLFGEGEVPFEKVELGHIEAVEENIERTLEIDNLFLQGRGANRAEQDIRKEIKQLKALFKEATTGDEKKKYYNKDDEP